MAERYLHLLAHQSRIQHRRHRRLRRKVQESCGRELPLHTLRAVGFAFHVPVEVRG